MVGEGGRDINMEAEAMATWGANIRVLALPLDGPDRRSGPTNRAI